MVPTLVALALAAGAAPGERIGFAGFDDSGSHFAVVLAEPGKAEGRLVAVEAESSLVSTLQEHVPMADTKPQLSTESWQKFNLGNDLGAQLYRSGTKLKTEVEVRNGRFTIELLTRTRKNGETFQTVALSRDKCRSERVLTEPGTDFNLASVWSSREESGLAVVVKYTSKKDGSRRHALVAWSWYLHLNSESCTELGYTPPPSAADSKRCYEALRGLKGAWASLATVKDFEGGAKLAKYTVTFTVDDATAGVHVDQEPAVGPIFDGPIVQCSPRDAAGKTLALTLFAEHANDSFPAVFEIVVSVRGEKRLTIDGGRTDFPSEELKPAGK